VLDCIGLEIQVSDLRMLYFYDFCMHLCGDCCN